MNNAIPNSIDKINNIQLFRYIKIYNDLKKIINNKPKLTAGYKLSLEEKLLKTFENTELVSQKYYHEGAGGDETDNCTIFE